MKSEIWQSTIEAIKKRGGTPEFPTLSSIDSFLWGYSRGAVTVVGARPGEGKTSFLMQTAFSLADKNKKVLFISLEMSPEQLCERLLSCFLGISSMSMKTNRVSSEEWQKIDNFIKMCVAFNLEIEKGGDRKRTDYEQIVELTKIQDPDIIFIDHIQRIKVNRLEGMTENTAITEFMVAITDFAKSENRAVVVASQLRRHLSELKSHPPTLQDLMWSGAIEQNADAVLFLYRPARYGEIGKLPNDKIYKGYEYDKRMLEYQQNNDKSRCEIHIAKNRNGSEGKAIVRFIGERYKFVDYEE